MTARVLLKLLRPADIYLQLVVASTLIVLGIFLILVVSTGLGPLDLLGVAWRVLLVQFALTVAACSAVHFVGAWIGRRRGVKQQG